MCQWEASLLLMWFIILLVIEVLFIEQGNVVRQKQQPGERQVVQYSILHYPTIKISTKMNREIIVNTYCIGMG